MNRPDWPVDNPLGCPLVYTVGLIAGKWKPALLHLLASAPLRHAALRRLIPPISQKMLTQQLRELEADGIVLRTVYPGVPPQVDYRLSDKGQRLAALLDGLYAWGALHRPPGSSGSTVGFPPTLADG